MRTTSAALLLLAVLAIAIGCQSIVGIEDRTYGGQSASSACNEYCAEVLDLCTGENAVYAKMETCLGVCNALPPGDPIEPANDNSLACRVNQLTLARNSNGELSVYCPRAGPGGDGTCGTNCESYCQIFAKACPDDAKLVSDCQAKCVGLRVDQGFDVVVNHDGDSMQCRLVHTSAATVEPETHCQHARIQATSPCTDPPGTAPSCDDYCQLVMAECTGDVAVYDSVDQCKAACAALPRGTVDDTHQDSVGCRKYHSYNAVLDPATHCPHAGPAGDGHCGTDNCESYCLLAAAACPGDFSNAFQDQAACMLACTNTPGSKKDSGYTKSAPDGATVQCRIHHAVLAFTDQAECASALGGGACQ